MRTLIWVHILLEFVFLTIDEAIAKWLCEISTNCTEYPIGNCCNHRKNLLHLTHNAIEIVYVSGFVKRRIQKKNWTETIFMYIYLIYIDTSTVWSEYFWKWQYTIYIQFLWVYAKMVTIMKSRRTIWKLAANNIWDWSSRVVRPTYCRIVRWNSSWLSLTN